MLTVPSLRVQQFASEFYLLNLAAADIERLVRFEVLGEAGLHGKAARPRSARACPVNWAEIERKVQTSDDAFQRPILRKKIEELGEHYRRCRDDGGVPAIPGAVLLTTDEPVGFTPSGANPFVGLVQLRLEEAGLRVLDGQHRLLALAALLAADDLTDAERDAIRMLQVPAILFSELPSPAVVEMFVTINSKHTRLNPSLLFSLRGRQLYSDPVDALIHDAIGKLNDAAGSPLQGHVKMLGVGPGKVPQAGLASEMALMLRALRGSHPDGVDDLAANLGTFFTLYFEEVALVFADVWTARKSSIRSGIALRAFIQAAAPVAGKVLELGGPPRPTVKALVAPWATRIGGSRFETAGAWRAKAAGGGKETTRVLARELIAALGSAASA